MPDKRTSEENLRTNIDGTEYIRLIQGGPSPDQFNNYKSQLSQAWVFGSLQATSYANIGSFARQNLDGSRPGALQVQVTGGASLWHGAFVQVGNNADSVNIAMAKTRSSSPSGFTALNNDDTIGGMYALGADGSTYIPSAFWAFEVDDPVSGGSVPTKFSVFTGSSGFGTRRFTVDPYNGVWVGNSSEAQSLAGQDGRLNIISNPSSVSLLHIYATGSHTGAGNIQFAKTRSSNHTGHSALQEGDYIGGINALGTDGSTYVASGYINFVVDDTVSSGVVPVRIAFATGTSGFGSERLTITSEGYLVKGLDRGLGSFKNTGGSMTPNIQMLGTDAGTSSMAIARWSNDGSGARLVLGKSRNSSIDSYDTVQDGDTLGEIHFQGTDESEFRTGAMIRGSVGDTPSGGMPTEISFWTAPADSTTMITRMKIIETGVVVVALSDDLTGHQFQMGGTGDVDLRFAGDNNFPPRILFYKTRSDDPGDASAPVEDGDYLGRIMCRAADGTSFQDITCGIDFQVDDTVSTGDVPGSVIIITHGAEQLKIGESGNAYFYDNFIAMRSPDDNNHGIFWTDGDGQDGVTFRAWEGFKWQKRNGGTTERMRLDVDGNLTVSGDSVNGNVPVQGANSRIQIASDQNSWGMSLVTVGNGASQGGMIFAKTRDDFVDDHIVVQDDDGLMYIAAAGSDGSAYRTAAKIEAFVDGTPGGSPDVGMPGRLAFSTTSAGSFTAVERLRIDSAGIISTNNGGAQSFQNSIGFHDPGFQVNAVGGSGSVAISRWGAGISPCFLHMAASRGSGIGTHSIVANGDGLAEMSFQGSNGSSFQRAAMIRVTVDGTPGISPDLGMPGAMSFYTTPTGSTTPAEALRISNIGAIFFPRIATTGVAANAFILNQASPLVENQLLRSTSSLRYKANVTDPSWRRIEAVRAVRPIEFNSKAIADDPKMRFVGYAAEEVAEIDPALVNYDIQGRPDGVMYDRVLLLKVAALEAELAELKTRM